MAWKEIHNGEPDFRKIPFYGICPKYNKEVTVTVFYLGTKICKTDLQKTYRKSGLKCSLLDGTNEASFSACTINCPLVND